MAERAQAAPRRLAWADSAKGIAIMLVVLFHAVIFLGDIGLASVWERVSGPLDTFRMPLFFFTAGLFAQKALRSTFTSLWQTRVAKLLWLYALWTLIWAIAFQYIPLHRTTQDTEDNPLWRWLRAFVIPNDSTWFLYALGLYMMFAWLVSRVPVWIPLVATALLSAVVGSGWVGWDSGALEKMATYLFFYILAVVVGPTVTARMSTIRWWWIVMLPLAYAASLAIVLKVGVLGFPGVRLLLGILGVGAGLMIALAVSRASVMSWVASLGRETLPVYLVHFYVVLGSVAALAVLPAITDRVPAVLWVPVVAALAIVVSLLVHRLTRRVPGLWDVP